MLRNLIKASSLNLAIFIYIEVIFLFRLNLLLYDHEVEKQASVRNRRDNSRVMGDTAEEDTVLSRNLCKNRLFPSEAVCEACYNGRRSANRRSGDFGSRRRIARYLYAVYTAEKVL